jgi:hypothetical protein
MASQEARGYLASSPLCSTRPWLRLLLEVGDETGTGGHPVFEPEHTFLA